MNIFHYYLQSISDIKCIQYGWELCILYLHTNNSYQAFIQEASQLASQPRGASENKENNIHTKNWQTRKYIEFVYNLVHTGILLHRGTESPTIIKCTCISVSYIVITWTSSQHCFQWCSPGYRFTKGLAQNLNLRTHMKFENKTNPSSVTNRTVVASLVPILLSCVSFF